MSDVAPQYLDELRQLVADLSVATQLGQRLVRGGRCRLVVQRGEEHSRVAVLAGRELRRAGWIVVGDEVGVHLEALVVVDVEESAERAREGLAVRRLGGSRQEAGGSTEVRPGPRPGVDVGQLETAVVEELDE